MSEYKASFFIVPSRILELPNITLQLLRFYETIFQFWNSTKNCWLKNDIIKKRTGITSDSTISEAFQYFEHHNEMKREYINGCRYIVQPSIKIQIDEQNDCPDKSKGGLAVARGGSRCSEGGGLAVARHNNKNINIKNNNKNSLGVKKQTPAKNNNKIDFPDDLVPKESHFELSNKYELDCEYQFQRFKEFHKSKGNKFVKWDSAFTNWLLKAHEIKTERMEHNHDEQNKRSALYNTCKQSIRELNEEIANQSRRELITQVD